MPPPPQSTARVSGSALWDNSAMELTLSQERRLRLDLAYDGTDFHGWAIQPGLRTVEGEISSALETIVRHPVKLTVAGRTDAGVHAAAQVAHVDVPAQSWEALPGRSDRDPADALRTRLNAVLARGSARGPRGTADVVINTVSIAPEGFDARFSATGRTYCYRLWDAPVIDPAERFTRLVTRELDDEAMAHSAEGLLGEHDFLSYCKPREGATTIRTLRRCDVVRDGHRVDVWLEADAFCHSMVRTIIGALIDVGEGRRGETWPRARLDEGQRERGVVVVPPHGLKLEKVTYPPQEFLATRAEQARSLRELA